MSKIAPLPQEAHFCTFSFAGSFFSPWVLVTNCMIVFLNTAFPHPSPDGLHQKKCTEEFFLFLLLPELATLLNDGLTL